MQLLPLALRSLARNKRRSALTMAAVTVGVAVVVFAHAFITGFLDSMTAQTIQARTGHLQVHRVGYLEALDAAPLNIHMVDGGDLLKTIQGVPGVTGVSRRLRFGGMASNGSKSSMVVVTAFDVEQEAVVCPARAGEFAGGGQGHALNNNGAMDVVLGGELARGMGLKPGGAITVTASGREGGMNALDLNITGVTRGAALFESKRSAMVPLAVAQQLTQMEGKVTEYALAVDARHSPDVVAAALRQALGADYEVSTWMELSPFLRDAIFRVRVILGSLGFILFLMVVFIIVNTMAMNVHERTREIGTMLAVGVRRRQVLLLFLLEAILLGIFGGLLGVAVGWSLAQGLAVTGGVQISPPGAAFKQVILPYPNTLLSFATIAAAMLAAMLAAARPARTASRLHPAEALRV